MRLVFSAHLATGEDNGDAHLKNLLNHLQVVLTTTNRKLNLEPPQEYSKQSFTVRGRRELLLKR
ncbi:MAG: hypothetical protein N3C57_04375 [Aquificaceae bacterium]|nr:hypothetical protein [Aquificaceae bacterium]MCX8076251.1 hypothetical protein [Aquificaceae bacterium]